MTRDDLREACDEATSNEEDYQECLSTVKQGEIWWQRNATMYYELSGSIGPGEDWTYDTDPREEAEAVKKAYRASRQQIGNLTIEDAKEGMNDENTFIDTGEGVYVAPNGDWGYLEG